MSVAGYLGRVRELRFEGWSVPAARVDGPVLVAAARPTCVRDGGGDGRSETCPTAAYESVAHYDPVLRSHCRLDREG